MTPIYNADTLARVASNARLAEYNRIKNDFVPTALLKINEVNFAAADAGYQSATTDFNLLAIGLTTEEAQNYFKIGLRSSLEELEFTVNIKNNNGVIYITCKW